MSQADFQAVGKGLLWIFMGQIIGLVGAIPSLTIQVVANIAGIGCMLYGLNLAVRVCRAYTQALVLVLISVGISLVSYLWPEGAMPGDPAMVGMLAMAVLVVSMVITLGYQFFTLRATVRVLRLHGSDALARRGTWIWTLMLISYALLLLGAVFMRQSNWILYLVAFPASLFFLVMVVLYLSFLWSGHKTLIRVSSSTPFEGG